MRRGGGVELKIKILGCLWHTQAHFVRIKFDVAGVGGSVGEKEDLDTEMNSNEALAVAL